MTGRLVGRVVSGWLALPGGAGRVDVRRDLAVSMPDGAVLLADHYRVRGHGRAPVVLLRTPYGRGTPSGALFAGILARRGMQVVIQSVRGTFGSGGEFRPFLQEREDGVATVAWLRRQSWCDGTVAMAGASYLGHTEWAVAGYVDPPLAAVCLGLTTSDFSASFYPGGAFSLNNLLAWSAQLGVQEEAPLGGVLPNPGRERKVRLAMSRLPLREGDVAAIGKRVGFWQDVTTNADTGDGHAGYWAPIDHSASATARSTPASMVSGWYDLFLPGQLADFTAMAKAGAAPRITVGPWSHTDIHGLRAVLSDQASWLAARLEGGSGDAAASGNAPVRAYLQGANRWLEFDGWPPTPSEPVPLYLREAGGLAWRAPEVAAAPDEFCYDPADPTPSVGGPLLFGKAGQCDNGTVEARDDVLVYTSAALSRHLDVVGEVSARVYLRTEPAHADVFVRLCDVDRRGVSHNVCDGILRLRPGAPETDTEGVVAANVAMAPTGYRFRRGHRVRMQVAGGAFPRFARNHGTGAPVATAVATRLIRYRIEYRSSHPSHVVLPVLSRGAGYGPFE